MPQALACSYCRRQPAQAAWRPFCSRRCKMADLGRWLNEDYRIPAEPASPDEPDEAEDGS